MSKEVKKKDDEKFKEQVQEKVCNILLLGSMGQGKSSLGNFLLGSCVPELTSKTQVETFSVGGGMKSVTKTPQLASVVEKDIRYNILDTPGLNESDLADLTHLTETVKALERLKTISAVIIVIMYGCRMDSQMTRTLEFYRHFLGVTFGVNLMVVISKFCVGERDQILYSRNGIGAGDYVHNMSETIAKMFGYSVVCYAMDSHPCTSAEFAVAQSTRAQILCLAAQLPSFDVKCLRFPKPASWVFEEQREAARLLGCIHGWQDRMRDGEHVCAKTLALFEQTRQAVCDLTAKCTLLEAEIRSKESDELAQHVPSACYFFDSSKNEERRRKSAYRHDACLSSKSAFDDRSNHRG